MARGVGGQRVPLPTLGQQHPCLSPQAPALWSQGLQTALLLWPRVGVRVAWPWAWPSRPIPRPLLLCPPHFPHKGRLSQAQPVMQDLLELSTLPEVF